MRDFEVLTGERRGRRRIYGIYLSPGNRFSGRMIFGLIVLTLGVLWTLDNLGLVDSGAILRWWPALLVVWGVMQMTGFCCRQQMVSGAVFSIAGLVLLGTEAHLLRVHFWQLWPVVMIVLGASLITRSFRGPAAAAPADRLSQVSTFVIMGGLHVKNESQEFRGGDVSAVMGGVEVDLRGAKTVEPQVVLDVFAWWGGIDLFVPRDWRVVSEVIPMMAGFEDHSVKPEGEARTTLVIRGMAVMGGIEVKN
jgi:predicted membrane protein